MSKTRKPARDVAQDVTDRILDQLETGTVPWHQPWKSTGGQLPRSMSTKRPYRGINSLLLGMYAALDGYTSPWWGTYKQIEALGGQVRKGEKASLVVLYKTFEKDERDDTTGEIVKRRIPLLRSFNVFNANQADGLPERFYQVPESQGSTNERIDHCEEIVVDYTSTGPKLVHGGDRAFYSPFFDMVTVPELDDFETAEHYYSTMFHELTHSTGHKDRLNREGIVEGHKFGDTLYAAEELVAELGAAMLCAATGIEQAATVEASAAYVANWLQALRNDKSLVLKAAAKAQKAVDLIAPADEAADEDDASEEVAA